MRLKEILLFFEYCTGERTTNFRKYPSHIPCKLIVIRRILKGNSLIHEVTGNKLPHLHRSTAVRMYSSPGFKMVLAVLFACLCLLQQLDIFNCQVIGIGSCQADRTDTEEDLAMKVKNMHAAFDRYRLQTNKIERELLQTNELLVKAEDRISKLGK